MNLFLLRAVRCELLRWFLALVALPSPEVNFLFTESALHVVAFCRICRYIYISKFSDLYQSAHSCHGSRGSRNWL